MEQFFSQYGPLLAEGVWESVYMTLATTVPVSYTHLDIVSPEFKLPGSKVVLLRPAMADALRPEAESLKAVWAQVQALMREGRVLAAYTPGMGGVAEALFKMCAGNSLGFRLAPGVDEMCIRDRRWPF